MSAFSWEIVNTGRKLGPLQTIGKAASVAYGTITLPPTLILTIPQEALFGLIMRKIDECPQKTDGGWLIKRSGFAAFLIKNYAAAALSLVTRREHIVAQRPLLDKGCGKDSVPRADIADG